MVMVMVMLPPTPPPTQTGTGVDLGMVMVVVMVAQPPTTHPNQVIIIAEWLIQISFESNTEFLSKYS
eukprot:9379575-Ditylum_brightwellii.AAC.1